MHTITDKDRRWFTVAMQRDCMDWQCMLVYSDWLEERGSLKGARKWRRRAERAQEVLARFPELLRKSKLDRRNFRRCLDMTWGWPTYSKDPSYQSCAAMLMAYDEIEFDEMGMRLH